MKLQELLMRKGHTQRSLAKAANVSDTTVNFIIHGVVVPRAPTMKRIADVLGVGIEEIDEFNEAIQNQIQGKENRLNQLVSQAA